MHCFISVDDDILKSQGAALADPEKISIIGRIFCEREYIVSGETFDGDRIGYIDLRKNWEISSYLYRWILRIESGLQFSLS